MKKHEWLKGPYQKSREKAPERHPRFETSSGIALDPVYDASDATTPSELPGEAPFTRGLHPTMYRSQLWTMRQYAGFGDAEQSNRRYRYLLEQGQTGLSVAFDLPTQMGHDSDAPMALGEVGRVGVAIDSLDDMRRLFDGIPLDRVSTSMTINATAATLLALYVAVGEEQGVARAKLRGTVQNDILKEYIARGTYIYPPQPSMRLITDVFAWCSAELPAFNPISISGYHIREAGATAVQELAFTLADGVAYVQAACNAGLQVDSFGPQLSFFFNVHNHLFEEVAKFRAARRLWAKLMGERFGAKNPRALQLRFHAQTAGSTLTAQQPDNNVVRVTLQALAAVLGGAQSLHTNSRDEALALPSEQAVQLALRTQQILGYESGVADVADPLGGSHLVEELTNQLEAQAYKLIENIDSMGGMVAAIEQGYPQKQIQDSAYRAQGEIERGDKVVVGVNRFQTEEPPVAGLLRMDPELERRQVERLRAFRTKRAAAPASKALSELEQAAKGTENLVPRIYAAVKAQCTVGEIANTLRTVFGKHQEILVV